VPCSILYPTPDLRHSTPRATAALSDTVNLDLSSVSLVANMLTAICKLENRQGPKVWRRVGTNTFIVCMSEHARVETPDIATLREIFVKYEA
jgi:hypothetical protein